MPRLPQPAALVARVQERTGVDLAQVAAAAQTAVAGLGDEVSRRSASARLAVEQARETAVQAREAVAALHRVALRADAVTAELEEPLRAIGPALSRLARTLDDPVVEDLPDMVRQVRDDALPVLRTLAETNERMAVLTDTTRALAGLPGAALLGLRRPGAGRVVDPAPPARPPR